MKKLFPKTVAVFFVMLFLFMAPAGSEQSDNIYDQVNDLLFEQGKKPPFLGIFAHTDATYGFPDIDKYIQEVNRNNPYIVGYAFRIQWRVLHPEKNRIDWEGLE